MSLLPCHFNSICDVHPYYNDRIEHWKKYFSGKCNLQPISKRFVGGAFQAMLTNKRKNGQNCSLALYHRVFFTKNEKKTKIVWVKSHGKLTKRIIEWISVHSKKFWDVYCTECIVSLAFKGASDLKIQWYRDFIRYDNLDTVFLVRISLNACRVFCTFCAQLSMYYLLL